MNIKHPEFLFLALLIPVAVVFFYWAYRKRNLILQHLGDWKQLREQLPTSSKNLTLTRYFLLFMALTMIVIALISPRWSYDWQEVEMRGANVYIAIDVSKSMLAEDISPNRLTRAKFEMAKLLDIMSGDKVGLIVFAGDAFLQTPLTHDYTMVQEWLSRIDTSSVPVPGTSIRSAIDLATKGFEHIESEAKILILISDGEEYDKATMDAMSRARSKGVKIYAIGVGTEAGSPVRDDQTGELIVDKSGQVVISKLNDAFLRELAKASGGTYLRSTTGDFQTKSLYYDHIRKEIPSELLKSGKTKRWYESYRIFVTVALLALLAELLLTIDFALFSIWKRLRGFRKPLIVLLLCSLAQPSQANILDPQLWLGDYALSKSDYHKAREHYLKAQVSDPHNSRLSYNLAVASYKLAFEQTDPLNPSLEANPELLQESAQLFTRATETHKSFWGLQRASSKLLAKAFYNLANALVYLSKFPEAAAAYQKSLSIDPNNEDAKYNLERIQSQIKEQSAKCPPDNNQEQQNQEQQKEPEQQEEQQNKQQRQNMDNLMQGVNDSAVPPTKPSKPKQAPDPEHWW